MTVSIWLIVIDRFAVSRTAALWLLILPPLCGGESWAKGPQGSRQEVDFFSPAHGGAVEKHGRGSRTWRAQPGKYQVGWPPVYSGHSALCPSGRLRRSRRSCGAVVTLHLGHARESDSPSAGGRKLLTFASKPLASDRFLGTTSYPILIWRMFRQQRPDDRYLPRPLPGSSHPSTASAHGVAAPH